MIIFCATSSKNFSQKTYLFSHFIISSLTSILDFDTTLPLQPSELGMCAHQLLQQSWCSDHSVNTRLKLSQSQSYCFDLLPFPPFIGPPILSNFDVRITSLGFLNASTSSASSHLPTPASSYPDPVLSNFDAQCYFVWLPQCPDVINTKLHHLDLRLQKMTASTTFLFFNQPTDLNAILTS